MNLYTNQIDDELKELIRDIANSPPKQIVDLDKNQFKLKGEKLHVAIEKLKQERMIEPCATPIYGDSILPLSWSKLWVTINGLQYINWWPLENEPSKNVKLDNNEFWIEAQDILENIKQGLDRVFPDSNNNFESQRKELILHLLYESGNIDFKNNIGGYTRIKINDNL